ncbi:nucleoporin Nup85-like protein [Cladochytrium replicatum]|nr:nucleoporin Nup85-like protein [Cladochytrium replicatum]
MPVQEFHLGIGNVKDLLEQNRTLRGKQQPLGKDIVVYPTAKRPREEISTGHDIHYDQDRVLSFFRIEGVPQQRRLFVNSTFTVFADLQDAWASLRSGELPQSSYQSKYSLNLPAFGGLSGVPPDEMDHLGKYAENYRQEIVSYLSQLRTSTFGNNETDVAELELFDNIHKLWQLCQSLYFSPNHGRPVSEDLLLWVNSNMPAPTREDFEAVSNFITPHTHPDYWNYVHKCIIRGHYNAASAMLAKLPEYYNSGGAIRNRRTRVVADAEGGVNPVEKLIECLTALPRTSQYSSRTDFENDWEIWHDECARYASEDHLFALGMRDDNEGAHVVRSLARCFEILIGGEQAILDSASTWVDAFVAYVFYQQPWTLSEELGELLVPFQEAIDETDMVDVAVAALLAFDLPKAIRVCSRIDWWLVSHLSDLVAKLMENEDAETAAAVNAAARRDSGEPELETEGGWASLREFFVFNYADLLVTHPALWRVGLEYLTFCPQLGTGFMEEAVVRIKPDSPLKLRKLLSFCERHGLLDQKKEIHRTAGTRKLKEGRLGEAILHFAEAGEYKKVTLLVDRMLEEYVETGSLAKASEILDGLPSSTLESVVSTSGDRMNFLINYRQFHALYIGKQYQEAATLLVQLLNSATAPKWLSITLLVDALPLLVMDEVLFGANDTFELMRCLEDVVISHKSTHFLSASVMGKAMKAGDEGGVNGSSDPEKTLEMIRLALTRNVARAIVSGVP